METQIFYWTGCVIWWGICLMVIAGIAVLVVVTPLVAFYKSRAKWWRWMTLAKFADLGWTQKELNKVASKVGGVNDQLLCKMMEIIEAGDEVKQSRQRLSSGACGNSPTN